MLRLDRLALSQLDIGLRRLSLLSLGQRGYATYTRSKDSYGGKKSTNSLSHSIELAGAATKKKLYGKSKFEREVNAPRRHDPHAKKFNRPAARGLKFGRTDGSYNGSKYTGEHLSDSSSKDSFNFRRRDQDTTSIRGHIASGTRSSKPDYAHSKYGKEDRKPDFKNTRYGKDDRKPDSRNLKYGKEGRKSGSITNRLDPNANVGPPNSGNFAGLRVLPVDERNRHAGLLANIDSFDQLKINPSVRDAIKLGVPAEMEYVKPTDIQKLSIKAMCSGPENKVLKSYLLAAETGSGKTLAYLIPLMSKLKDLEAAEEWKHIQHHPIIRSVVLVPTMELVEQVTKTVKNMSHQVKLRAFGYGVNPQLTPAKITSQRVDVLITTPTKFINLYSKHPNLVQYCSFMVADEADSLLDESFGPEITKAVAMCPNLTELVFTSATIPRSFDKLITKQYPDINRLVTPGIHRVSRRIEFTTVNVWEPPFLDNKELALNQALYSTHTDNKEDGLIKRVIVFRNNRKDVKSTVDFINKVGYDAFGVDGSVPYETRDALIKDFITPAKKIDDSYEKKPHIKVMVTTDLLARGIDMSAVRNVVLYDIPNTSIDLIHRIGRTGRMGKRGRVYLFVNKSENKPWIQGLKSYIRKGMSLA